MITVCRVGLGVGCSVGVVVGGRVGSGVGCDIGAVAGSSVGSGAGDSPG